MEAENGPVEDHFPLQPSGFGVHLCHPLHPMGRVSQAGRW